MFQPSETDAVMLTAMAYFEFQQLTPLWLFLKNKSHSLNSAELAHYDIWREIQSPGPFGCTISFNRNILFRVVALT